MVKEIENPPAVQGEEALLDQPRTLEQLTTEILYIKAQTCVNYWEMAAASKRSKPSCPTGSGASGWRKRWDSPRSRPDALSPSQMRFQIPTRVGI